MTQTVKNQKNTTIDFLKSNIKLGNIGWFILGFFLILIILGLIFEFPTATLEISAFMLLLLIIAVFITILAYFRGKLQQKYKKLLAGVFFLWFCLIIIPFILLAIFQNILIVKNYFDFVLFTFDLIFIILGVFNPLFDLLNFFDNFSFEFPIINLFNPVFTVLGQLGDFRFIPIFSPIFTGPPNELTNTNPIFMRILSDAAVLTLEISFLSIVYGFFLAVIVALILVQKGRLLGIKVIAQLFVDFFRSTPLLVQLLIIFWGIPNFIQGLELGLVEMTNVFFVSDLIPADYKFNLLGFKIEDSTIFFHFSVNFDKFIFNARDAGILALTLNTAAYQSEIIRAGIQSIPTGQTEAARGLGMTNLQTMRYVILPQALRLIIPPLTNEGINVILNSSLVSVIAFPELLRRSQEIYSVYFNPFPVLITAALFYFFMTFTLAKMSTNIERRSRIPGLGVSEDV